MLNMNFYANIFPVGRQDFPRIDLGEGISREATGRRRKILRQSFNFRFKSLEDSLEVQCERRKIIRGKPKT